MTEIPAERAMTTGRNGCRYWLSASSGFTPRVICAVPGSGSRRSIGRCASAISGMRRKATISIESFLHIISVRSEKRKQLRRRESVSFLFLHFLFIKWTLFLHVIEHYVIIIGTKVVCIDHCFNKKIHSFPFLVDFFSAFIHNRFLCFYFLNAKSHTTRSVIPEVAALDHDAIHTDEGCDSANNVLYVNGRKSSEILIFEFCNHAKGLKVGVKAGVRIHPCLIGELRAASACRSGELVDGFGIETGDEEVHVVMVGLISPLNHAFA